MIDVVYGHNDPMAEAAIISAQNAKKDLSKMAFVGIDGLPTPDGGIRSVMDGRITVTYVYPTGGAQAIDEAVKILEQGAKPEKTMVLADRRGHQGQCRRVAPEVRRQVTKPRRGGRERLSRPPLWCLADQRLAAGNKHSPARVPRLQGGGCLGADRPVAADEPG